jgi:hypothetical protein
MKSLKKAKPKGFFQVSQKNNPNLSKDPSYSCFDIAQTLVIGQNILLFCKTWSLFSERNIPGQPNTWI